jgi:3-phosphoglycerate kinase
MLKTLSDFDFKNKKVLVRCDFNVSFDEKGKILDDFRIKKTLPTIDYLLKNQAKVILISHLGRPKGRDLKFSLKAIASELEKLLKKKIKFLEDCLGEKVEKEIEKMKEGEIILLENLRFYKQEEENNLNFAENLAKLADIYLNEAFSVCHRNHASVVSIPKFLPSGMGFLLKKEIEALEKVLKEPLRPLVVIIGGAKIETKIKVIEKFLEKADHLLLGGEIANSILRVKGISIGKPWPEEKVVKKIEKLNLTNPKLHLPVDVIASPDKIGKVYIRQAAPGEVRKKELILDIGPETINIFSKIIKEAKMIFWNGPLGLFEENLFERGTREICQEICQNQSAFKIAGGGETIFAIKKYNFLEKFDHLSTGGGAMLDFLSGEELPGLKALSR